MFKRLHLIFFLCLIIAFATNASDKFVSFHHVDDAVCLSAERPFSICFDSDKESKTVEIAVNNLAEDFSRVLGVRPEIAERKVNDTRIIIGTVGQSKIIDNLVKERKIDGDSLRDKWEKYILTVIDGDVIIAGSDRRGTIFGIYELSQQIGVSPWYWWCDVPVQRREAVFIRPGVYTDGEPAVKYRGIFINDEWPSFGTWSNNLFGGINSKMYAHMFELLLRLKANYLWPAMWDSAFNEDDPLTQSLANDYGIVMGTSHHEPMMRAHKEYTRRRDEIGAWDFVGNRENIEKFFTEGVERAKGYENIITIGMRGDGDVAMGKDDEECIEALKEVIKAQRSIISDVYKRPASEVPQLWAIFTEVQRYYDAGMTVPDDVTLLFCDNNWGYIRRTGPEKERNRKGGMGMYYHIDMNGGPWNDRWVNTTTPAKIREQLNLAYQTGIDRIWIINVGDLKPKEMPIDFIMHYAWNPNAYPADKIDDYTENWARSIFGRDDAKEIAEIVTEYSKLNLERKPEVQRVGIYSPHTGEAQKMMQKWDNLEKRTLTLSQKIQDDYKDAFFQLVEYPAVASAGVAKMYLAATLGDSLAVNQLFERDKALTEKYNKGIANGKWDGMMLDKHIGYTQWSMPDSNVAPTPAPKVSDNEITSPNEISLMACDYTKRHDTAEASWIFLPGLGRGKGCMGISPVTAASCPNGDGPTLEYEIALPESKESVLALGILPTNDVNPARGLRIGVAIDDNPVSIVDARQGYVDTFQEYTPDNLSKSKVLKPLPSPASDIYLTGFGQPMRNEIFDNIRWLSIPLGNLSEGTHTFKVVMVDPELVVEKIIVNPDNSRPSYHGRE